MRRLMLAGLAVIAAFVLLACAVPNGGGTMMKRGVAPSSSADRPPDAEPAPQGQK